MFTVWEIGCALAPNLGALIGFRLLCGIGGSACLTIGGGVISDLFPVEQRGKANAVFSFGPLFGPVIGMKSVLVLEDVYESMVLMS